MQGGGLCPTLTLAVLFKALCFPQTRGPQSGKSIISGLGHELRRAGHSNTHKVV